MRRLRKIIVEVFWLVRRIGCLTIRRLVIYNATKSEARGVWFTSLRVRKRPFVLLDFRRI